ncbi:hypothetical protein ACRYJU_08930 [Alloalcanivorax xenomutans]|uniref:hypothetical protein n=1 Tax=Alloalcanivorax xenomutans TaxID=1094342 RepID=UPI003D9AFB52
MPNKKEMWVEDVRFIFDECARLMSIAETNFKKIPRKDAFCTLPHPNGGGDMICGFDAYERVSDLAEEAARRGGLTNKIESLTIRRPLEELLVQRFLRERRPLNVTQMDRVLSAATKMAKSKLETKTHLIPCHLMRARDPRRISIGPVTFHNRNSMRSLLLNRVRGTNDVFVDEKRQMHRRLLADAIRYYRNFQWVAEVKVADCDAKTSSEVAMDAVTAALDCIHLLLGFEQTARMQVGGTAARVDRRAGLTISQSGSIRPSLSTAWFGHVGYPDGWSRILEDDDYQWWIGMCGVVLEASVTPDLNRPISRRFLDALQWFGEGCREKKASTQTIKFMTSVERILGTGEKGDISRMISDRAANLCFSPDEGRQVWRDKTKRAYSYRSRLVHGSMSPRDPDAWHGARLAAEVAQTVLRGSLQAFGVEELRASEITEKRLIRWFDQLEVWASRIEKY